MLRASQSNHYYDHRVLHKSVSQFESGDNIFQTCKDTLERLTKKRVHMGWTPDQWLTFAKEIGEKYNSKWILWHEDNINSWLYIWQIAQSNQHHTGSTWNEHSTSCEHATPSSTKSMSPVECGWHVETCNLRRIYTILDQSCGGKSISENTQEARDWQKLILNHQDDWADLSLSDFSYTEWRTKFRVSDSQ